MDADQKRREKLIRLGMSMVLGTNYLPPCRHRTVARLHAQMLVAAGLGEVTAPEGNPEFQGGKK